MRRKHKNVSIKRLLCFIELLIIQERKLTLKCFIYIHYKDIDYHHVHAVRITIYDQFEHQWL
jgi:hypothetical protein